MTTKPEKNKEVSCGGTEAQKWPVREVTSEKQNLEKTLVQDIKVVLADQRGCVQKFFGEGERIQ